MKSLRRIREHDNDIIRQIDCSPLLMNPARSFVKILIALPQTREEVAVGHIMLQSPLKRTYIRTSLESRKTYKTPPDLFNVSGSEIKLQILKINVAETTATLI